MNACLSVHPVRGRCEPVSETMEARLAAGPPWRVVSVVEEHEIRAATHQKHCRNGPQENHRHGCLHDIVAKRHTDDL